MEKTRRENRTHVGIANESQKIISDKLDKLSQLKTENGTEEKSVEYLKHEIKRLGKLITSLNKFQLEKVKPESINLNRFSAYTVRS